MSFSDIPLTSQTAPVLEFVVLWTNMKTQKNKRWNDGILKLHIFNKRVMVYDEAMHLVVST